jgi:hypothetical protein
MIEDIKNVQKESSVGVQTVIRGGHDTGSMVQDARDYPLGSNISKGLRTVATIVAQTTLVVALLFYFGWARTHAALAYFGVDPGLAHLSVNDYVLRSLDVTVKLLVVLGILALALLAGHHWFISTLIAGHKPRLAHAAIIHRRPAGILRLDNL